MADNKSVVRRYVDEVWSQGKLDVVDEICAEDYVEYDPNYPGGRLGRDGVKQAIVMFRKAFPDLRFKEQDWVVEDDKVVTYWTVSGTFLGELAGQPPTGKRGEGDGVTFIWLRAGRLVEGRTFLNPTFRQQVGYHSPAEVSAVR